MNGYLGPEKTEKSLKMDYLFKEARRNIDGIIQNCINYILPERKIGKEEGWTQSQRGSVHSIHII